MEHLYIRQILDGDVSKFSYFVKTYKHMAYTIAFRIVGNAEDAEEVIQDSFLKAYKSLHKFRGDSKFSTWFHKIVVNNSLSRIKKNEYQKSASTAEDMSDILLDNIEAIHKQLAHEDQKRFINQALAGMEVEDRLILTLYYLSENSLEEIAQITSIVKENIKMKLHRARTKMFAQLCHILKSEIQYLI